jgi:hypothetical protein
MRVSPQPTSGVCLPIAVACSMFWLWCSQIIEEWANNSFKPNPLRSFKTPSGSSSGSA